MPYHITSKVRRALDKGQPVVALESTVISHGLPYPSNLDVAQRMEAAIRDAGAIPATVAVLGGRVHVGLEKEQLERLAQGQDVRKVSRQSLTTTRDLPDGHVISRDDLTIKRPGTGISPARLEETIGRTLAMAIVEDMTLTEGHLK